MAKGGKYKRFYLGHGLVEVLDSALRATNLERLQEGEGTIKEATFMRALLVKGLESRRDLDFEGPLVVVPMGYPPGEGPHSKKEEKSGDGAEG